MRIPSSVMTGSFRQASFAYHIIETAPTSEGEGCLDRWTVISSAFVERLLKENRYHSLNTLSGRG
jgi:hypothetical protein